MFSVKNSGSLSMGVFQYIKAQTGQLEPPGNLFGGSLLRKLKVTKQLTYMSVAW